VLVDQAVGEAQHPLADLERLLAELGLVAAEAADVALAAQIISGCFDTANIPAPVPDRPDARLG
jgi:hypothetical protein